MGGKSSKSSNDSTTGSGGGNTAAPSSSSAASSSSTQSQPRLPNSILINIYEPVQSSMMGGVYHSGVELFDTEYFFGQGTSSLHGITSHRPRQLSDPNWKFRETVNLGPTSLSRDQCRQLINEMKNGGEWAGNTYSLTGKNCNHFSEAVCKSLGVDFPSWINRGAKIMNKIGMGSGSQQNQQLDMDGRPLRPEDAQALVMEKVEDVCLDSLLDLSKVGMLGGRPSVPLLSIIPVNPSTGERTKLSTDKCIMSDADAQLLLFLPFKKPVKLLSFLLRFSTKEFGSIPATMKFYLNKPNMDFSDVDSMLPTHECTIPAGGPGRELTKLEQKDGVYEHVITFPPVKFQSCTFLTIFIESNCSDGKLPTKIYGLTFVGRDK